MTEYVILRKEELGDTWRALPGSIQASSPAGAIRAAFVGIRESSESKDGDYVAVPKRSWKPVAVSVEVHSRVKIGA